MQVMKLHARGPFATAAAVLLLLLSSHAVFQTSTYAQAENGRDSEVNIDPKALARELRADICASNATQIRDFYREIIKKENRTVTYPPEQSRLFNTY